MVIEGATHDHDAELAWCRDAPCVVIGLTSGDEEPSKLVDVVLRAEDEPVLERIVSRIDANPTAARVLVEVLRIVPHLSLDSGLQVESLAYSMLLAGPEFERWLTAFAPPAARQFDGPAVRLERDGDELRVALARPENRNAFSAAMRDELFAALTVAELDASITRVVLEADGPCFSSGGDLTEFGTAPDVVRAHHVRTQRSVGRLLGRLAPRVVARVHGACVGAGVELPTFASTVEARADATFRLPEVTMGLIPGAGGTVSISRRIGPQATARLALLGDAIDAETALAMGLIDSVEEGVTPSTHPGPPP